jgi:glycosyltransferase involved in cell wall biosynthesis
MTLISLILPAHNEGASIYQYLCEISKSSFSHLPFEREIVVMEDGSSDNTRSEVQRAKLDCADYISISPQSERLGYSEAVIRGFGLSLGEIVVFIDSDGQYDPDEISKLVSAIKPNTIIVGYRNPRVDSINRIIYSKLFGIVFNLLFGLNLRDPSSPFIAANRQDLNFLNGIVPKLSFGFWWEFQARIKNAELNIIEIPVTHRPRIDGKTQVYNLGKLPKIVFTHIVGLFALKRELKKIL